MIAHVVFWLLLGYAWTSDELGGRVVLIFLGLWLLGFFGLSLLTAGGPLFLSAIAILDIVLVFLIFKGDVRIR